MTAQRLCYLLALLLGSLTLSFAIQPGSEEASMQTSQAPQVSQASPLDSIAFIGASVSAGFGNFAELEVRNNVKLGGFVKHMLVPGKADAKIHDFGSSQFFTDPTRFGEDQIGKAIKAQPTMVVGVDFLFWYAFGFDRDRDPRRSKGLEKGLKMLENIEVPLIIGDLPNVYHALEGRSAIMGGRPVIRRGQMPSEEERAVMNKRILEWASTRKNVVVLPLAQLMKEMIEGNTMRLHGQEWTVSKLEDALQKDLLHPNVRGNSWVAIHAANCATKFSGVSKDDFVWSPDELEKRMGEELSVARAKQKAREDARARRKAKREEKAKQPK